MTIISYISHFLVAVIGMVVIVKRMRPELKISVFIQYGVLFTGLLLSLLVPIAHASVPVSVSVLVFLAISAPRWKNGPPEEVTRPGALGPAEVMQ